MKTLSSSTLFLILLIACAPSDTKSNLWENTLSHKLERTNTSIRLPLQIKRTTKYRISEDIPHLQDDSTQLALVESSMHEIEFEDGEIDFFVDTTASFRLITILDTPRFEFGKLESNAVRTEMENYYEQIQNSQMGLRISRVDSHLKSNNQLKILKIKHRFDDQIKNNSYYRTVYFISSKIKSYVIYELSDKLEDLEYYLWSIREKQ